ncbi:MAG: leucine dehydrogenase [Candidatus Kapabacteria bacterium]|nr:leucine dehydrogenase [Candidatus Kapabacteria bacterium]MDW8012269.1 Glu/Leu/Phe/Val dehydrogenase dimerization domain-containing protein [Bacteroidota bacterium]
MALFDTLAAEGHEQVIFCWEPTVRLRAIIAIHDTTLGPALGGVRMWPYASEEEALQDVLRLSRAMTYKAAVAGLNLGGGKAVILGDHRTQKTEALFRAFGRFVESLGGRYITAEDVGTTVADMEWIRMETRYVTGVLGKSGDPSPVTAHGVYYGMKACAKVVFGSDTLANRTIAVQGAGNVARHLVEYLVREGAQVFVADIYPEKARRLCDEIGGTPVGAEEIYDLPCDIFSPNALGGVLNSASIPRLRCAIVAGGANNPLADESADAQRLHERGILYAPDYVINAGGLMNVAAELTGNYDRKRVLAQAAGIYDTLLRVFRMAQEQNILPTEAAARIAEERIAAVRALRALNAVRSRESCCA